MSAYHKSDLFKRIAIDEIRSFAKAHRDVVNAGLKKLASGSSRVVYDLGDGNVLKVAKNKKGIAQNEVESYYCFNWYDACAKVIETSDNTTWLVMEKCEKVTPAEFKQLTGISIFALHDNLHDEFSPYSRKCPDSTVINNEFYQDISKLLSDNDLHWGDVRLANFGKVKRDGKWKVVLLDFGYTNRVKSDFYDKKR